MKDEYEVADAMEVDMSPELYLCDRDLDNISKLDIGTEYTIKATAKVSSLSEYQKVGKTTHNVTLKLSDIKLGE
jgi:hypothetical protein